MKPEAERSDWTEQDLLTVEEAGKRVEAEIAETEDRLAAADTDERDLLERRLSALRARAAHAPVIPG